MLPNQLKVQVKSKHIKKGIRSEAEACPIALSLIESIKSCRPNCPVYVDVCEDRVFVSAWNDYQYYKTSKKAAKFIYDFDNKKSSVKPQTFIFKKKEEN